MRDDAYRKGAHVPESAARGLFSRHWRGSHSERGSHLRLQSEHVEILSRASTSKFFQWAGYMYSISESSGAVCAPAREM